MTKKRSSEPVEFYGYKVRFAPEAQADLHEFRDWIARKATRKIANGYIKRIGAFCQTLSVAPLRRQNRFGDETGLRIIGFERDVAIVFRVFREQRTVEIVGVFEHGRDPSRATERR